MAKVWLSVLISIAFKTFVEAMKLYNLLEVTITRFYSEFVFQVFIRVTPQVVKTIICDS